MTKPAYLQYLQLTKSSLATVDGLIVPVWELSIPSDGACLASWGHHFRQHYCLDTEIDDFRAGTGLTRAEYLLNYVFPDGNTKPGPSIRSGDFGELLISDYLEYIMGYWVPRGKYGQKESRNESAKGADILGFRIISVNVYSSGDELLTYEVKAQLTDAKYTARLQVAVNDSSKDYVRAGISLNAAKQRLIRAGNIADAKRIERFQNINDNPFVFKSGAAAVLCGKAFDEIEIAKTETNAHSNKDNIELVVVRGEDLMTLAHALYQKAADDA
jgi:hypothetical protein